MRTEILVVAIQEMGSRSNRFTLKASCIWEQLILDGASHDRLENRKSRFEFNI